MGLPKVPTVIVAAIAVIGAVSTGSFRRFERLCLMLIAFSLLVIPIFLVVHPPIGQVARDTVVPGLPHGAPLSTVMLLIIAIVGTTVAPWQLFFQQSYVIDKRITPRWINYERVDLIIGIVIVMVGGICIMAVSAAAFGGHAGFGQFTDAGGTAAGLALSKNSDVSKTMVDAHETSAFEALGVMELTGALAWLGLWQRRRLSHFPQGTLAAGFQDMLRRRPVVEKLKRVEKLSKHLRNELMR